MRSFQGGHEGLQADDHGRARGNFPTPQPANRCFASVWNGPRFPFPESRSFAFSGVAGWACETMASASDPRRPDGR